MSQAAIHRIMTSREWGLLIALSVLWGGSFFFTGVAVKELPPFTIVFLRVGGAAVILLLLLKAMGLRLPTNGRIWAAFFGMGFLNNVMPFCLIVWGQTEIASGLASIINATTPLFTVIVAHILTSDEKITSYRIAGVLIGLSGVVAIIGPQALQDLTSNVVAQLACLGAALSYAFASVFGRRFKRMGVSPVIAATGQVTASALMLLPMAFLVDHPWALPIPSWQAWGAIIGIAALSTALAYVLYFRILASAGATNLLLVTFLIPVTGILLGTLVLGERLNPTHFLGMALIGAGLAAIDGRLLGMLRQMVHGDAHSGQVVTPRPSVRLGPDD